jgi:hypothetical protein
MMLESPLSDRISSSDDVFSFLMHITSDIRSGKVKLKQRGAANTRELAKTYTKKKNRLKTFKQFSKD